jgi:long-chain acyl-CoA synthetase
MNYNVEDTEHNGIPVHGRGEVCYRGWNVFQGYYKMPEVTKETLDTDGWLHSGDIGVWNTNGTLKIVDRKKNIFKLAQGEYVAPEKIENIYLKSELVMQAFVYGDSLQSCLVAVIVPDPDVAKVWGTSHNAPTDIAALVKSAEFKKAVADSMSVVAKADKLFGFEQAREITLVPTPFTPNDILTPSFKLKRNEAKKMFQKEIDAMYSVVGDVAGKKVMHQDKH